MTEITTYPCAPEDLHSALTAFQGFALDSIDRLNQARDQLLLLNDLRIISGGMARPLDSVLVARDKIRAIVEGTPTGLNGLLASMGPAASDGAPDYAACSVALYQYLEVLKAHPTQWNAATARNDLESFKDILMELEGQIEEIEGRNETPADDPELAPGEQKYRVRVLGRAADYRAVSPDAAWAMFLVELREELGDETPAAYNGDEVPPEVSVTLVRDQS